MRGIGVEEAAAVRAQLLDGLLRGHRPLRNRLSRPFNRGRLRVAIPVLDDALRGEQQGGNERDRQQEVDGRAGHVDPEVADRRLALPRKAADEGDGDGDARGGRGEVLYGQRRHLSEVAHRRLADVRLPVRVGDETDRGIERGIGRDLRRAEPLRVQGQVPLQPLDEVREDELRNGERQQRARVLRPSLLDVFPDSAQPVDQPLERPQDRVQKRALALEQPGHEDAERLGQREDQREEEQNLVDPYRRHDTLRSAPVGAARKSDKRTTAHRRRPRRRSP